MGFTSILRTYMCSHFSYIHTHALYGAIPMGCVITTQNAFAYPGKFQ
jgi:hypothetical protein